MKCDDFLECVWEFDVVVDEFEFDIDDVFVWVDFDDVSDEVIVDV